MYNKGLPIVGANIRRALERAARALPAGLFCGVTLLSESYPQAQIAFKAAGQKKGPHACGPIGSKKGPAAVAYAARARSKARAAGP